MTLLLPDHLIWTEYSLSRWGGACESLNLSVIMWVVQVNLGLAVNMCCAACGGHFQDCKWLTGGVLGHLLCFKSLLFLMCKLISIITDSHSDLTTLTFIFDVCDGEDQSTNSCLC